MPGMGTFLTCLCVRCDINVHSGKSILGKKTLFKRLYKGPTIKYLTISGKLQMIFC